MCHVESSRDQRLGPPRTVITFFQEGGNRSHYVLYCQFSLSDSERFDSPCLSYGNLEKSGESSERLIAIKESDSFYPSHELGMSVSIPYPVNLGHMIITEKRLIIQRLAASIPN